MTDPIIAALIEINIPGRSFYYFTGDFDYNYQGNTYLANKVRALDSPGASTLSFGNALFCEVVLSASEREILKVPANTIISTANIVMVGSDDDGNTWQVISGPYSGKIISTALLGSVFSFEIAPRNPVADRGIPLVWSHSERIQLVGSQDQGLAQLDLLVNGLVQRHLPEST